jgi:hypothetical protein
VYAPGSCGADPSVSRGKPYVRLRLGGVVAAASWWVWWRCRNRFGHWSDAGVDQIRRRRGDLGLTSPAPRSGRAYQPTPANLPCTRCRSRKTLSWVAANDRHRVTATSDRTVRLSADSDSPLPPAPLPPDASSRPSFRSAVTASEVGSPARTVATNLAARSAASSCSRPPPVRAPRRQPASTVAISGTNES